MFYISGKVISIDFFFSRTRSVYDSTTKCDREKKHFFTFPRTAITCGSRKKKNCVNGLNYIPERVSKTHVPLLRFMECYKLIIMVVGGFSRFTVNRDLETQPEVTSSHGLLSIASEPTLRLYCMRFVMPLMSPLMHKSCYQLCY